MRGFCAVIVASVFLGACGAAPAWKYNNSPPNVYRIVSDDSVPPELVHSKEMMGKEDRTYVLRESVGFIDGHRIVRHYGEVLGLCTIEGIAGRSFANGERTWVSKRLFGNLKGYVVEPGRYSVSLKFEPAEGVFIRRGAFLNVKTEQFDLEGGQAITATCRIESDGPRLPYSENFSFDVSASLSEYRPAGKCESGSFAGCF